MSEQRLERFARTRQLLGQQAFDRLLGASVTIVGLGAVGSYAVEGLARAGVQRMRLVDFDIIRHSNINRQLYALESTVGRAKCELAAERVHDINPDCTVEALKLFAHVETLNQILDGSPDIVIDAIDAVGPKVELLTAARQRGLTVVSSMGAALRTDPTLIRRGPLAQVENCPLARQVRRRLRRRDIPLDMACVYSIESSELMRRRAVIPGNQSEGDYYERGRKRSTLGSLPTLTGMFGLTVANTAIEMLIGGFE